MDYLYELKQGDSIGITSGPYYEERHWETGEIDIRFDWFVFLDFNGPREGGMVTGYTNLTRHRWKDYAEQAALAIKLEGVIDLSEWTAHIEPTELERWHQEQRDIEDERWNYP